MWVATYGIITINMVYILNSVMNNMCVVYKIVSRFSDVQGCVAGIVKYPIILFIYYSNNGIVYFLTNLYFIRDKQIHVSSLRV